MNLLFGESVSTQEVIEAIKTNDEIVMQIDQESSSYPVSGYSYGGDWVRLVFKSDIYIYEYETIKGWDRTEISPEPYLKPATGIPATDLTESLNNDIQSGRELPQVTGSDDGKVLGVVSGEWAKMDAPGGERTFYAENTSTDTPEEVTSNVTTSTKTVTLQNGDTIRSIVKANFSDTNIRNIVYVRLGGITVSHTYLLLAIPVQVVLDNNYYYNIYGQVYYQYGYSSSPKRIIATLSARVNYNSASGLDGNTLTLTLEKENE